MWSHQPECAAPPWISDEAGQRRVSPRPVVDARPLDLDVPVVGLGGDG